MNKSTQKRCIRCSLCNEIGHNRQTCMPEKIKALTQKMSEELKTLFENIEHAFFENITDNELCQGICQYIMDCVDEYNPKVLMGFMKYVLREKKDLPIDDVKQKMKNIYCNLISELFKYIYSDTNYINTLRATQILNFSKLTFEISCEKNGFCGVDFKLEKFSYHKWSILPVVSIPPKNTVLQCSICLEDNPLSCCVSTNCNHDFCKTCMMGTIQSRMHKLDEAPPCPLCRTSISKLNMTNTYDVQQFSDVFPDIQANKIPFVNYKRFDFHE